MATLMVVTPKTSFDEVHPETPPGTHSTEQGVAKSHVVGADPQTDTASDVEIKKKKNNMPLLIENL